MVFTLHLTQEEEQVLDGEKGEFLSKCMKVLVRLGDVLGAEKLVSIKRAHISGVSIMTAGEELALLLEEAINEGATVCVRTTTNPCAIELEKWKELGIRSEFVDRQKRVLDKIKAVGMKLSLSCTPYYKDNVPEFGEIIAFAESSAVIYANSILGAKTLRHGSIDALAAAFIGKVPLADVLIDENRAPEVFVDVKHDLKTTTEYGLLGFLLGELLDEIPIIQFKRKPKHYELKQMGAAMATSGKHAIYHVIEVTPEWSKWKNMIHSLEKIIIDKKDLIGIAERFGVSENPEFVVIGCPHAHPDELKDINLEAKKWLFCGRSMLNEIKNVARNFDMILADTCPVVMPLAELGINEVATNSVKAAWYIPKLSKNKVKTKLVFI